MICVVCQDPDRAVEHGRVCPGCTEGIARDLARIPELYDQLTLEPAVRPGAVRVSGSHEPPLPLRVDVLDLTARPRAGSVHDRYGDQVGHQSVAGALDGWVRDWASMRREGLPVSTVLELAGWLAVRLDWACAEHPAVDEFAGEMRELVGVLRAATGDRPAPPQRLPTPCQRCNQLALVRMVARDVRPICCRACERSWSEDEYAEWAGELAYAVTVKAAA